MSLGHRVRVYTPYGELLPGMAYLVRRLLENTSNESFLRPGFAEHVCPRRAADEPGSERCRSTSRRGARRSGPDHRRRMPVDAPAAVPATSRSRDFSREADRARCELALRRGRDASSAASIRWSIDGEPLPTTQTRSTRSTRRTSREVVGTWRRRAPAARRTPSRRAAKALRRVARHAGARSARRCCSAAREQIRERRVRAGGVGGLRDRQALARGRRRRRRGDRLLRVLRPRDARASAEPQRRDVPGENNAHFYEPRGVAVVIAPWNFPLAILSA